MTGTRSSKERQRQDDTVRNNKPSDKPDEDLELLLLVCYWRVRVFPNALLFCCRHVLNLANVHYLRRLPRSECVGDDWRWGIGAVIRCGGSYADRAV